MRIINTYSGDFSSAPPKASSGYEFTGGSQQTGNAKGAKDSTPQPDRNFLAQVFFLLPRRFQMGCYAGVIAVCFYGMSMVVEAAFPARDSSAGFEEEVAEPGFGFRGSIRH